MPDHQGSLGGETFSGEEQQDPAEPRRRTHQVRRYRGKNYTQIHRFETHYTNRITSYLLDQYFITKGSSS
jgi:hypothetical protein